MVSPSTGVFNLELEVHGLYRFESIDELSKFCTWKKKTQYRKMTL